MNAKLLEAGSQGEHCLSLRRFPRLANLAVGFLGPAHLPWLRSFMGHSGGKLETLQLQLTLFDDEIQAIEDEENRSDEWDREDEDEDEDASDFDEDEDRYDDRFAGLPEHVRAAMHAITGGRGRPPTARGRPAAL